MRRSNFERDEDIFKKTVGEKWSFRKIAKYFNMSVSSVYVAYKRAKNRGVRF